MTYSQFHGVVIQCYVGCRFLWIAFVYLKKFTIAVSLLHFLS